MIPRTIAPAAGLALATLLVAGSATATASDLPELDLEYYTLDNGLGVILYEDHSTPIVGVNIWYHVGSKNERPGRSGFAHLFEHMMYQGSEHQDGEYFGPIQSVGGTLNGSTNEDRTNYWEIVPSNHLERALLLQADRMGWLLPAMTQEKLANQKDVVRNERRQWEGSPYSCFWLQFNELFYPKGHPYDHSVIGIHEDLENATLEDVQDFFRTYYVPSNATLAVSGDFDPAQAKEWIAKYFGPIPPGQPFGETSVWIPEMTTEKRVRLQDRVELPRLFWTWHSPPFYHDGDADLDLAATILGRGRTSRLYRRLVHDTKLAQSVSASQESQQLVSYFLVDVTLAPGADREKVERIVDEELARFAAEGPTRAELERAKNGFEAGFVRGVQQIGSFGGINDRLNRYVHYVGRPDWFRQDYDRYLSRTQDTVQGAFRRWIGPGRMVTLVEPRAELRAAPAADVDYSVLPAGGPEPTFDVPQLQRRRLPNGLELVVMEQTELPLARLELIVGGGSASDPDDLGGLCAVASSMLLEGTKRHDKFAFENALDFLGSDLDVWSGDDRTVISLSTLTKHLDRSLELMAEALLEPALPESEFADDKARRLVDLRRENEDPNLVAAKVSRRMLYGDEHPYGRLGSGTPASMAAIDLDDVRGWLETNLVPGNATLLAVGDVQIDDLEKRVTRWLGGWTGEAPSAREIPKPERRKGRTVYLVDKPGDPQSTVRIAHFGLPRSSPDWETVFLSNRVLGGFFSSRLNLNLREDKGYTYSARSYTTEQRGTSSFVMTARVQTEVTASALTEFMRELEGVAGARPITAEELEFAKSSILLGYPRDFETIRQLARALDDQITFGLPDDDLASFPRRIAAVDLAMVNETASAYYRPEDVAIVVVGDVSRIEDSVRALGLGPIRHVDRDGNLLDENPELSRR